jgi:hypothetical protein
MLEYEQQNATLFEQLDSILSQTIIFTPHNPKVYIASSVSLELSLDSPFQSEKHPSIKTFKDYYELRGLTLHDPKSIPLVESRPILPFVNVLHSRKTPYDPVSENTKVYIPTVAAEVLPIPNHMFLLARSIPSVLCQLSIVSQLSESRARISCLPNSLTLETLLHATTATSVKYVHFFIRPFHHV